MDKHELKQAREDLGLSQQGLAYLMKLSKRTYQKYESGENPVTGPVETVVFLLTRFKSAVKLLMDKNKVGAK